MRSALVIGLVSSACAPSYEETVVNRGRACVYAPPLDVDDLPTYAPLLNAEAPYEADKPAAVVVTFPLPGPACIAEDTAECTVELVGPADLVVRSRVSWSTNDSPCTREARYAQAACLTPVLSSQSYAIQFGDSHSAFDVPGLPSDCIEN